MNAHGLYEIYDFWHKPFWQTPWFIVTMVCLIICLVLLGFYCVWRVVKKRVPKRTLWQIALDDLALLKKRENLNTLDGRSAAYVEMTQILKKYASLRYNWPVSGMTDREFMAFLLHKGVDSRMVHVFEKVSQGCELIKFAQEQVDHDRVVADCLLSEDFVRITIPSERR